MANVDASLSDHEWRLKEAAEATRLAQPQSRTVTLSNGDWRALDTALCYTVEMIHDARNVFDMIAWTDDLDRPGVASMMRLAGKALLAMVDREIPVLERLDDSIRHTTAEIRQAERAGGRE